MSSPLCCACRLLLYVEENFPAPSSCSACTSRRASGAASLVHCRRLQHPRVPSSPLCASLPGLSSRAARTEMAEHRPASASPGNAARKRPRCGTSLNVLRAAGISRGFKESAGHASSPCAWKRTFFFSSLCDIEGHFGAVGDVHECSFFLFKMLRTILPFFLSFSETFYTVHLLCKGWRQGGEAKVRGVSAVSSSRRGASGGRPPTFFLQVTVGVRSEQNRVCDTWIGECQFAAACDARFLTRCLIGALSQTAANHIQCCGFLLARDLLVLSVKASLVEC